MVHIHVTFWPSKVNTSLLFNTVGASETEVEALRATLVLRQRDLCTSAAELASETLAKAEACKDVASTKKQLSEALERAAAAEAEVEGLKQKLEGQASKR